LLLPPPPSLSLLSLHDALPIYWRAPARERPPIRHLSAEITPVGPDPESEPTGVLRTDKCRVSREDYSTVTDFARLRGWSTSRPLDRKSTRLNSSHVKISYAVVC